MVVYEVLGIIEQIDEVAEAIENAMGINCKDEAVELLMDYKDLLLRMKVKAVNE